MNISCFGVKKNWYAKKESSGQPARFQGRIGQRQRLYWVQRPEQEQAGVGAALQPTRPQGPHTQAVSKKSKFPKYGLQPASGSYTPSGAGHPNYSSPVTPEHGAAWPGPPAPALVTTGSASRVSQRKIPLQPSQRGWEYRQRGLPLGW